LVHPTQRVELFRNILHHICSYPSGSMVKKQGENIRDSFPQGGRGNMYKGV